MQEVEINLIITDYCMPGITGYDLLKRVKVLLVLVFFFLDSIGLLSFPSLENSFSRKRNKDVLFTSINLECQW